MTIIYGIDNGKSEILHLLKKKHMRVNISLGTLEKEGISPHFGEILLTPYCVSGIEHEGNLPNWMHTAKTNLTGVLILPYAIQK